MDLWCLSSVSSLAAVCRLEELVDLLKGAHQASTCEKAAKQLRWDLLELFDGMTAENEVQDIKLM